MEMVLIKGFEFNPNLNTNIDIKSVYETGKDLKSTGAINEALAMFLECIRLGEYQAYACEAYGSFLPKLEIAELHMAEGNILEAVRFYMEAVFDPNNTKLEGLKAFEKLLEDYRLFDILDEMRLSVNSVRGSGGIIKSFKAFQEIYMDYPREVHIETTGRCNAKCSFCPHDTLPRKNDYMEEELFDKIISDLKEIPVRFHISPFKVNEPLMDKNFFDRVNKINAQLPNAYIRFFSNFNIANEEIIKKICDIKNLASIWVSLNSLDREEYSKMMKLDIDRTIKNVSNLLEVIKKSGAQIKVTIGRVGTGDEGDSRFIEDANKVFVEYKDLFEVVVLNKGEWINHFTHMASKNQFIEMPCLRWFEVSVTCTGKVALCCMDGECGYSIGDVRKQNLLHIYNGSEYRQLREKGYKRKFINPCSQCSYD